MNQPVTVSILGKEYQVACPEDQKPALLASAKLVHENMEKIRATGKVVGLDRVAVMAALNLANALIAVQSGAEHAAIEQKLTQLEQRIRHFLTEERQLEF